MHTANSSLLSSYCDIQPQLSEVIRKVLKQDGKKEISFKVNHLDLNGSKI
jgi:hypothetical protein